MVRKWVKRELRTFALFALVIPGSLMLSCLAVARSLSNFLSLNASSRLTAAIAAANCRVPSSLIASGVSLACLAWAAATPLGGALLLPAVQNMRRPMRPMYWPKEIAGEREPENIRSPRVPGPASSAEPLLTSSFSAAPNSLSDQK